jgi:RNA polymerase-binding transcription factor DksA
MDEADSATDEFDHDLALSQLSTERDALDEVNEALRRIAAGTYGICEESGQAIPAARLRAVPWTRFTREVEERMEQKGLLRGARVSPARTVRKGERVWLAPEEEPEEDQDGAPTRRPNDEALPHIFSPPGAPIAQQQASSPERKARKRRKA